MFLRKEALVLHLKLTDRDILRKDLLHRLRLQVTTLQTLLMRRPGKRVMERHKEAVTHDKISKIHWLLELLRFCIEQPFWMKWIIGNNGNKAENSQCLQNQRVVKISGQKQGKNSPRIFQWISQSQVRKHIPNHTPQILLSMVLTRGDKHDQIHDKEMLGSLRWVLQEETWICRKPLKGIELPSKRGSDRDLRTFMQKFKKGKTSSTCCSKRRSILTCVLLSMNRTWRRGRPQYSRQTRRSKWEGSSRTNRWGAKRNESTRSYPKSRRSKRRRTCKTSRKHIK